MGGPTIAIAKANMSYGEYQSWCAYYEKHGTLDCGRRIDRSLAWVASIFAQGHLKFKDGHTPSANDFTLFPVSPPEDEPASIEDKPDMLGQIANLLRSTAIKE